MKLYQFDLKRKLVKKNFSASCNDLATTPLLSLKKPVFAEEKQKNP